MKQAFAHWHPNVEWKMHRQLLLSLPSPPERPHKQSVSKIMLLEAASAHRLAGPRCVSAAAAAASSIAQGFLCSFPKPGAASVAIHPKLALPPSCPEPAVAGTPTATHASPAASALPWPQAPPAPTAWAPQLAALLWLHMPQALSARARTPTSGAESVATNAPLARHQMRSTMAAAGAPSRVERQARNAARARVCSHSQSAANIC